MFAYSIRKHNITDQETFYGYKSKSGAIAAFKRKFHNWQKLGCRIYNNGVCCSAKNCENKRFGKPDVYDKIADLYLL